MSTGQPKIPELIDGVDVRSLPLTAVDGFVLSRIDGRTSVTEIGALTGLPPDTIAGILEKLVTLGAIRWKGEAPAAAARSTPSGRPAERTRKTSERSRKRVRSGRPSARPRRMMAESGISEAAPPRSDAPSKPPGSERPGSRKRRDSARAVAAGQVPRAPATPRVPGAPDSEQPTSRHEQPRPEATPTPTRGVQQPEPRKRSSASSAQHTPVFTRKDMNQPSVRPTIPPATNNTASVPPAMQPVTVSTVPLYDARELEEDVALPMERRKQVLDLFYKIDDITFYDALGVPQDATKKEIRSAYFGLSKVFHPDTMFRKELGSYKSKMEKVFKHLTEAYETLGKKKKRKEYDAYLKATKKTVQVQRILEEHKDEPEAAVEKAISVVPPARSVAPPSRADIPLRSSPPPEAGSAVTEARRKLAQKVVAKRFSGLKRSVPPPASPTSPPPAAPTPTPAGNVNHTPVNPRQAAKDLARALQRAKGVAQTDKATVHMRKAKAAEESGDLATATSEMRKAISEAPERPELHGEHQRLSELLAKELAADYEAQAKFEQGQNKWASAALAWAKVVEGRPDDAHAARSAAHALLRAGGDLHRARGFAQKSVQLNPRDIESRIVLAKVYLSADLQLNARRELESAAKLDPTNEMVKNLLADMKA